jgi:hypothetical protein
MSDPTETVVDPPVVEDEPLGESILEETPELEVEPDVKPEPKTQEEQDEELAAVVEAALAPEIPKEEAEVDEKGAPKRDPITGKFLKKAVADVKPDVEKPKAGVIDPKTGKLPEKEAVKKPDPLTDPIEKGVSERTTARIHSLIELAKESQAKADESRQLFQHIADTGTSPENFGATISYLRLFNSKDPADNEKAFLVLQAEYRALAVKLGKTDAGVDLLAEYPDLKEEVRQGHLHAGRANEIALSRTRDAATARDRTTQKVTDDQTRDFETAKTAAVNELNVLGNQMASDPEYARKYAILVPALRPVFERLHPSQWKAAFQSAYAGLKLPSALPALPADKVIVKGRPLRPKAPSGQGSKQAVSLEDAIQAGLDSYSNG